MNIIDDHANRNAIRTQIKENMFVEAGAGAGKTTLVVERIINQLKEGASPEKFVVITFTNKATEELYSRIVQKLREEVGKAQKGSDEEKCLKKALEVIDLMTISTIHSFCYKLLIEKAFLTDLRLDARLVEAEELEQIQADFLDGQIKNIPPKKRQELYQVFKPSTLKNNLKKGFCDAGENPDNIVYLYDAKGKETEYSAKMAAELMRECCNDALPIIYKELNAAIMEYVKKPVVVSSAAELKDSNYSNYTIKEFYTYAEAAEASSSKLHEVFSAFCTMINTGRILNKISAFKAGDLKKGIGKKKEDIQAELEEKIWSEFEKRGFGEKIKFIRACLYNEMISIILDAVNEYRKYKKEQGNFITNNDLLVKAKKLVCENEEARKFFANRYSYYYVDEFQDTDDIQVDMIYTLAESNPDSTLFVVGDPKQSIYRFRGADISVYKHVKKLMAEHCLELSKNHRSHPRVIKWVNEYFGKYFKYTKDEIAGVPLLSAVFDIEDYIDMEPYKTENNDVEAPEEKTVFCGVYNYKAKIGSDRKEKSLANEKAAADVIQALVGKQYIYDYDDKGRIKGCRPIEYRDILVLTNSKTVDKYRTEMNDRNIPLDCTGKKNLSKVNVLKNFICLFDYLTCSKNTRAQTGAELVLAASGEEYGIDAAKKRLASLKEKTAGMQPMAVAQFLADNFILLLDKNSPSPEVSVRNAQTEIVQMLETAESVCGSSASELSVFFDQYRQSTIERETNLSQSANEVRLMNLHKAKGLEAPIVIVPEATKEGFTKTTYSEKPTGSTERKCYMSIDGEYTAYEADDDVTQKAQQAEAIDNMRLLYVLCTRPKEALIVINPFDNKFFIKFNEVTGAEYQKWPLGEEPKEDDGKEADAGIQTMSYDAYIKKQRISIDPEMLVPEHETANPSAFESRVSVKKQDAADEEISENAENREEISETVTEYSEDGENLYKSKPRGEVYGTTLHRAYELYINGRVFDDEAIKTAARRAVIENFDKVSLDENKGAYEREIVSTIKQFTRDWKERLEAAESIYTELEFSFDVERTELIEFYNGKDKELAEHIRTKVLKSISPKIWVNGTADLVFVNKDGSVTVLDYKSNRNKDGIPDFVGYLREHYKGQLALYEFAMKKLLGVERVETDIVNYQTEV